jgi:hypothetical protein
MKRIAAWITANVPGHRATVEPSYTNTDRHSKGVRWRIPGKRRKGYLLRVYGRDQFRCVFSHDSSETYRQNSEVEDKVRELLR